MFDDGLEGVPKDGLVGGFSGRFGGGEPRRAKSVQGLEPSGVAARVAAHERRGEGPALDEPKGDSSVSSLVSWSRLGSVG